MPTWGEAAQMVTAVVLVLTFLQSRRNGQKIAQVHEATNGMKDALVAATEKESYARGVKAGADQPRD